MTLGACRWDAGCGCGRRKSDSCVWCFGLLHLVQLCKRGCRCVYNVRHFNAVILVPHMCPWHAGYGRGDGESGCGGRFRRHLSVSCVGPAVIPGHLWARQCAPWKCASAGTTHVPGRGGLRRERGQKVGKMARLCVFAAPPPWGASGAQVVTGLAVWTFPPIPLKFCGCVGGVGV